MEQKFKSCRADDEEDSFGVCPFFLTSGMRQLVDRIRQLQKRFPVVAVEVWNVGMLMLAAIPWSRNQSGISCVEFAIGGLLHELGLLIGSDRIQDDHRVCNFEGHTRRGERLIHRWLPDGGPAREVALGHNKRKSWTGYPDSKAFQVSTRQVKHAGAAKWVGGYWCRGGVNGGPIELSQVLELAKTDVQSGATDNASSFDISAGSGVNSRAAA